MRVARASTSVCAPYTSTLTRPGIIARKREIRSSRAALCKANMAGVSAMIERSGQRAPRRFDRPTDLVFRIHRIAWEPGTQAVHSSRLPAHERARPFEPCCLGPFSLGPVALSGPRFVRILRPLRVSYFFKLPLFRLIRRVTLINCSLR